MEMDRYNPFYRRKIGPTQEDLDYERDKAQEYAHQLEREAVEARQAARAQWKEWAADYAALSEDYDAALERLNRLEVVLAASVVLCERLIHWFNADDLPQDVVDAQTTLEAAIDEAIGRSDTPPP